MTVVTIVTVVTVVTVLKVVTVVTVVSDETKLRWVKHFAMRRRKKRKKLFEKKLRWKKYFSGKYFVIKI